jgi:segregation and condensation protein B
MEMQQLKNIVEAALLAAGTPVTVDQLRALFGDESGPEKQEIRAVLKELQAEYEGRGIEIREVASGFRVQVRSNMTQWLSKLWEERPPRYSRALMETLSIIAYRQPVTRGDIEEIRGVSVTSNIIRTLLEREWIKVLGHRDVPGKPAMFGTTRDFLDYFDLKKLDDLPPLAELAQLEPVSVQLQLETEEEIAQGEAPADAEDSSAEDVAENDAADENSDADPEAASEQDEQSIAEFPVEDDLDDDDELLSEEEITAATEKIDAIMAELSAKNEPEEDENEAEVDVPPGGVQPLVGLNAPGEEPPESATVASLDEARAAAAEQQGPAETDDDTLNDQPAEVVPLKTS